MAEEAPVELAAKQATEQGNRFREAAEKIRTRNDTFAKALGAAGTAAVGGIGYAEFADLFPTKGCGWLAIPLAGGVVLMAVAVLMLVHRFQGASRTVVTTPDLAKTLKENGLERKGDEGEEIVRAYEQAARLNEVDSLAAYQARAHRFERIADQTADADREADLRGRAAVIRAEILAAQARAGAFVIRRRAHSSLFGCCTLIWIGAFLAGFYVSTLAADKLESNREEKTAAAAEPKEEVELAKECAELLKSEGYAVELRPEACKGAEPPKPKSEADPTGADVAGGTLGELASRVGECREAAREAGEDAAVCAPVERAFDAVRGP